MLLNSSNFDIETTTMNQPEKVKRKYTKKVDNSAPVVLNAAQIEARRIPIEEAEITLSKVSNWQCHHCERRFSSESIFMRHHCEPKRRSQEIATPLGISAYSLYKDWMRLRKFGQPNQAAFLESKFYRSFINFAQLIVDTNISNPQKYIEIMVAGEIQPVLWCNKNAYALYLDWTDKLSDPIDQVGASINYLMDISEKNDVKLEDIFTHLGPQEIIQLVRQRRLSPWLLFCSSKFGQFLKTLDSSHLVSFNSVVNAEYWGGRFQKDKASVESIKNIAKQMGL